MVVSDWVAIGDSGHELGESGVENGFGKGSGETRCRNIVSIQLKSRPGRRTVKKQGHKVDVQSKKNLVVLDCRKKFHKCFSFSAEDFVDDSVECVERSFNGDEFWGNYVTVAFPSHLGSYELNSHSSNREGQDRKCVRSNPFVIVSGKSKLSDPVLGRKLKGNTSVIG
jgi:hypothetical protein